MGLGLSAEDLEGVLAVVERCERALNARQLSQATVDALRTVFGFDRSWVMVTASEILELPRTGTGAIAGIAGWQEGAEFLVACGEGEPVFSAAAVAHLVDHGVNTSDEVSADLGIELSPRMAEMCARLDIATWLTVWLDTELETDGYLVVVSGRPGSFGGREKRIFEALRGHLTNHLRRVVLQPSSDAVLGHLSPRESEVTKLLADGLTNPEIARILGIGLPTVKKHVKSALRKSGLHNRTALAVMVRQGGALS